MTTITLDNWKGKSSFSVEKNEDVFEIITYQKKEQEGIPKKQKTIILKSEVNEVLNIVNYLNKGNKIKTRIIGERYYYTMNWDEIFADRKLHIKLNLILRILDHYEITKYSGGYTTVLKSVKKI